MEPHAVPSHPIRAHRRSWFLLQNRGQVPRQYGGDETREVAAVATCRRGQGNYAEGNPVYE